MPDSQTLRILLLGAPAIYHNEQPLQIQRRLMRWMLFYLSCQKEMVGRSDLILLFWPDENEESARRHLRETLSKLRAQLPNPGMIITEQDKVGLDPQCVYSDTLEFQRLFNQVARACAQTPASSPLTQAMHDQVLRAVQLWRSERFLAGASAPACEPVADWLMHTSQQLETQRQRLLERLADHDTANGDLEGAIHWLRMALDGDQTNESLHYRLLTLLQKQGHYGEAINYGAYLQALFRREGFEELPPALLALIKKIRAEGSPPAAGDRPAWPALSNMRIPFVGRENIRKDLQFAISRGEPVIILGESGSGKSRLVQELYTGLTPPRRLLLISARMMEHNLPFQPLVDMLRREIQAEEWKQVDLVWAAPLALLLPELPIIRPEIRVPQSPTEQKHSLLFEAIRQLFLFLSKRQRFLLFMDNAQWCDASTLAALSYLIERHLFGEMGAFILAARSEEIGAPLENFLSRPQSEVSIRRIALPRLDHDHIGQIARLVLGERYVPQIVDRLEQETGGNPLFLLETLRLVLDYTLSPQVNGLVEHLPLASGIHAQVSERLKQLPPDDRQILNGAAVLKSAITIDMLEQVSQLSPEQTAESLERLEQANLLRTGEPGTNQYSFVHEKVREVVLLDLSPVRRRLLHLRAARVLEQKQMGQNSAIEAILAAHFEEAGEITKAFDHWLNAGCYAWRVYAAAEATTAFQHAEQTLQRLGQNISGHSIYRLYRNWMRMAYDQNDLPRLERASQALLQVGQTRQDPLLVGSAWNGLALTAALGHQPEVGLNHLEKAMPYLEQAGALVERVEALNHTGLFWMMLGKYAEAERVYEQALQLTSDSKEPAVIEARAQTEYRFGWVLIAAGWPKRASAFAEQSIKDAEEGFNQSAALLAASLLSTANCYLGQYQRSSQVIHHALDQASAIPIPCLTGELLGTATLSSLAAGNLDLSWTYARQALRIAEENQTAYLRERAYSVLGEMYSFLEDFEQAGEMFSQGSESRRENFYALNNLAQFGVALAIQGEVEAGLAHVERALTQMEAQTAVFFTLRVRLAKAKVFTISGRETEAVALLGAVEADAAQRGLLEIMLKSQLMRAQIALSRHQPGEALSLARDSAALAQSAGHLLIETEARALWIDAARMGDMTVPSMLGQRLRDCITVIKDNTHVPELRERLARKGWTKYIETI